MFVCGRSIFACGREGDGVGDCVCNLLQPQCTFFLSSGDQASPAFSSDASTVCCPRDGASVHPEGHSTHTGDAPEKSGEYKQISTFSTCICM